jgi:TonB family protein
MGYQALLFCPDEKLARVVSQVFTELDFTVEPVHEPFAAVKKLMSQRYDAIVVDCENEQNASLLFKSARNSSSNQSSLAIAVVEGQAGVAKSYRIGANLVLTKPINVEQAKGTLRVARGLLRKNQDAAAGATASSGASTAAKIAPQRTENSAPQRRDTSTAITPMDVAEVPDTVDAPAAVIAAAPIVASAPVVAAPAMSTAVRIQDEDEPIVNTAVSAQRPASAASSAFGFASAAAPAPAKEAPFLAAQSTKVEAASAHSFRDAAHSAPEFTAYEPAPTVSSTVISDGPSFGALDDHDSAGSGGKKKILIAAGVLVLAACGYFGYQKFGNTSASPASQIAASQETPQHAPAGEAVPATTTSPTGTTSVRASSTGKASALKSAAELPPEKSSTGNGSSSATDLPDSEPTIKLTTAAPVHVKSSIGSIKNRPHSEDAAPPSPSTIATATDNGLSALLTSATPVLPKPAQSTVKISQGVSQGLLIKRVPPRYPQAAKATHTQGEVRIEATINKEGIVLNPKVLHGDAVLAGAAVEAVRQWRYKPYYLDGEPVEIQTEITINFKLN